MYCVLRLRLRPMLPVLPILAGISVSLCGRPTVDACLALRLSPLLPSIDLLAIPGVGFLKEYFVTKVRNDNATVATS
eukprot:144974-Pyramimonas_sp.AAC.1